jgi:uncharacterized Ntn-hydrolase superfamily protein
MTFSMIARDPETGAFGMVIASSSTAVASRCLHLRPGVGVVASQNVTNPELGPRALDALSAGLDAHQALELARFSDSEIEYRQLGVVDSGGAVSTFSGRHTLGVHASAVGVQALAAGNLLATEAVPAAMLLAYATSAATAFDERLLAGLVAGLLAGGEAGAVRSAGLAVVAEVSWPVTNLRVDDHDDPIGELGRLLDLWLPQKDDYVTRALNPSAAPSYGGPGDQI